jgi:hypothetical protein
MADMHTEQDQRRSRWRSYFEQTLLGKDYEIEAATEARWARSPAARAGPRSSPQAGLPPRNSGSREA